MGSPLLALTADRPPELRATGANQTIEQAGLYGGAVRWAADVGAPEEGREAAQNRYWRSLVAKALITASGATVGGTPGPVHLNLALREPLLPDDEDAGLPGPWAGRPDGAAWTAAQEPAPVAPRAPGAPFPGPWSSSATARCLLAAACRGARRRFAWPVIAEPSSGIWGNDGQVRGGALLLGAADWLAAHRPDRVVVVGRPTLSRPVSALLADPEVRVETVAGLAPLGGCRPVERVRRRGVPRSRRTRRRCPPSGSRPGKRASGRVGAAVDAVLDARPGAHRRPPRARRRRRPAGAARCSCSAPPRPVRDVDRLAVPRRDVRVLANRGVAGIDGTISTAVGAALVHEGPAFALMGDLTFLHDLTGLVTGEGEPVPDLTIVVPDNDGGGIFAQLEPGEDRHARDYRRVFGTPHGRDLVAVARALGWAASSVASPGDLAGRAARPGGRGSSSSAPTSGPRPSWRGRLRAAAGRALTALTSPFSPLPISCGSLAVSSWVALR